MNLTFRKATVNDIDNLAKIRSIFMVEATGCSEIERNKIEIANRTYFEIAFAEDSFVAWIALDGDNIVATSGLSFYILPPSFKRPDGRVAHIMNMFTFPEYRKQGVGTKLFNKIIEEAKNRGYKEITLNATAMGRPLYEKYGFKDVHGDMVFYEE